MHASHAITLVKQVNAYCSLIVFKESVLDQQFCISSPRKNYGKISTPFSTYFYFK